MIIAPDLSALWLVREQTDASARAPRTRKEAKKHRGDSPPRGGLAGMWDQLPDALRWILSVAGLLVMTICVAIMIAQIGTAPERLEHKKTVAALRLAEERIKTLEQKIDALRKAKP
jgi:hypothetical protein